MPKRATSTSRPAFTLDASLPMPLYKQLYARLRGAILEGQLERGARLPSIFCRNRLRISLSRKAKLPAFRAKPRWHGSMDSRS